jgi:hypothetical protein
MRLNLLDEDEASNFVHLQFDERDPSRARELLSQVRSVGGYLEAELEEHIRLQFILQEPGDFWIEYVDRAARMKQYIRVPATVALSILDLVMGGANPIESPAFGVWIPSTI